MGQGFFRVISASRGEIKSLLEGLELFLTSQALATELTRKIIIVAQELLQNALEHGVFKLSGKERLLEIGEYETTLSSLECEFLGEPIVFKCERRSDEVLISVECNAEPFLCSPGESQMLSGRGLTIVKGLCHTFSVDPHLNRVSASLRI
jgi:anti-sigma regulatory factor (Ser/Thr protein kinase)